MKLAITSKKPKKLLVALVCSMLIAGALLLTIAFVLIICLSLSAPQPVTVGAAPVGDIIVCIQDEMICPDGTAVGRRGPKCEFAACPANKPVAASSWTTLVDETAAITYKYPGELGTKYIFPQIWPPIVSIAAGARYCQEPVRMVNGKPYCVSETAEGAAGTVYNSYRYSYADTKQDQTVSIEFTLGSPQCGNYDDPQMSECSAERALFDIDALADRVLDSVSPIVRPVSNETAPLSYDPIRYRVAETSDTACSTDVECITPMRYLILSNCPYSSRCLNAKCAVICPMPVSRP